MAADGFGANAARDLGRGWKVSPAIRVAPGETVEIANAEGPGIVQSIWFGGDVSRNTILRFYWDDQEEPAVESPIGDLFACGWGVHAQVSSLAVNVNPNRGLNCFWPMPFRRRFRVTLENRAGDRVPCYYQFNYARTDVPDDLAYFHAQFRRVNPLPYKEVYTILDGVTGHGHYVGPRWHGASTTIGGGVKAKSSSYVDGDDEYATMVGTGTEDYFGGSYDRDVDGEYVTYTTPYMGMHQVIRPDGLYNSQ